ncbi:hypothetical protein ES705_30592 [subsurface metagenome]
MIEGKRQKYRIIVPRFLWDLGIALLCGAGLLASIYFGKWLLKVLVFK